ncbi:hypothetical protein [Burkholderia gladioli]|uniref:hypothetical protein n=1 Tax=Burkholderia gladioli TaxID=28095 RepID=UPI001C247C69|nr:hypothetical protein [Burkholderia gladioli]
MSDGKDPRADAYISLIRSLLTESERASVILAAAQLDTELEVVLKHVLVPFPGGADPLFDADRALGSFSAKILMAHRLGIITLDFENSLQLVRKIRNDFAHQIETESLASSRQHDRVETLYQKFNSSDRFMEIASNIFQWEDINATQEQRKLVACCSAMIAMLRNSGRTLKRINLDQALHIYPRGKRKEDKPAVK